MKFETLKKHFKLDDNHNLIDFEQKNNFHYGRNPLLFCLSNNFTYDLKITKKQLYELINKTNIENCDELQTNYLIMLANHNKRQNINLDKIEFLDLINKNKKYILEQNKYGLNLLITLLEENSFDFEPKEIVEIINLNKKQLLQTDDYDLKPFFYSIHPKQKIKFTFDELNYIYNNSEITTFDNENIKEKYPDVYETYLNFLEKRNILLEKDKIRDEIKNNNIDKGIISFKI